MTARQRILALEAALCACEGISLPKKATTDLQEWINKELESESSDFGDFLIEQREAVNALANSPEVFGCDRVEEIRG